jgi:hypothetical protein
MADHWWFPSHHVKLTCFIPSVRFSIAQIFIIFTPESHLGMWLWGKIKTNYINFCSKKVDKVIRHPHRVTHDQFSLVSEKILASRKAILL